MIQYKRIEKDMEAFADKVNKVLPLLSASESQRYKILQNGLGILMGYPVNGESEIAKDSRYDIIHAMKALKVCSIFLCVYSTASIALN